jgi:hypothetical protein
MREIVMRMLFKVPERRTVIDKVPEGLRVFLEYYGDVPEGMPKEKEASIKSILEHAQVTGHWPEAGKPLFASPGAVRKIAGINPAESFAIPYGKVIRVEGMPVMTTGAAGATAAAGPKPELEEP